MNVPRKVILFCASQLPAQKRKNKKGTKLRGKNLQPITAAAAIATTFFRFIRMGLFVQGRITNGGQGGVHYLMPGATNHPRAKIFWYLSFTHTYTDTLTQRERDTLLYEVIANLLPTLVFFGL